jgi:hypothetical protein
MRSLTTLLPKLLAATDTRTLVWESAQVGYSASLGNFTVRIWEWSDEADREISGVSVNLNDKRGNKLDEIESDQFSASYPQLRELYSAVRRSALKVDQVIEQLESELDRRKPAVEYKGYSIVGVKTDSQHWIAEIRRLDGRKFRALLSFGAQAENAMQTEPAATLNEAIEKAKHAIEHGSLMVE